METKAAMQEFCRLAKKQTMKHAFTKKRQAMRTSLKGFMRGHSWLTYIL